MYERSSARKVLPNCPIHCDSLRANKDGERRFVAAFRPAPSLFEAKHVDVMM